MDDIQLSWTVIWAVLSTIASVLFGWAYWSLRKEFVTKKQYEDDRKELDKDHDTNNKAWLEALQKMDKRVQSIEQTYAKSAEVTGLSKTVTTLSTELHKDMKHINETIKRVERPLNLIVEAKINGK